MSSTEVEVVEQQLPPIATVQVTPEQAREQNDRINQVISAVLKEGHDFALIPGTPKPSLLKPGAEALQRFFGLGSQLGAVETGEIGDPPAFYARARCTISNRDGMVLAEADGWADAEESKWKKAPRNTIIQMATKRAYVSAIKTATGTSDHFTQDLEDQTANPQAASVPEGHSVVPDLVALPEEIEAFLQLYADKRGDPDTSYAAEWLQGKWGAGIGLTAKGEPSKWWLGKIALTILAQKEPVVKGPEVVPDPGIPALSVEDAARKQAEEMGIETVEAEVVPNPEDDDAPF